MTRYADPGRCPDCRTAIVRGAARCGACGLSLQGETAQLLFSTLLRADDLLVGLRAASAPAGAASTPSPAPAGEVGTDVPYPAYPVAPRRQPRASALRAASVPKILLALGAGCLLVAALVFLAVTWSVLGIGGRTATLVVLTLITGGLTARMARQGLRAAAESMSLVALGLLVLDLVGADRAGWFGDLSVPDFLVLLGLVLLGTGAGSAILARSRTSVRLAGAEVVAAIGVALLALGLGTADRLPVAPSLLLATLVAAAAAGTTYRLRLRLAAAGAAVVTGSAWMVLTGYGLDRVAGHDSSWATLWLALEVWPLLASAALVAAPAISPRLPSPVRVGGAAVAHLLAVVAVLAPVEHFEATEVVLVTLGLLAVAGGATRWLPRPWGLVNVLTQTVAAAALLSVGAAQVSRALVRLGEVVDPVWSGEIGDRLAAEGSSADQPAGWLLPLCLVALVGTGWALAHTVRHLGLPAALGVLVDLPVASAVLLGSVLAALALYPVPVWLVVAALVLPATGFTAWWLARGSRVVLGLGTAYVAAAVALALHAERLTAAGLLALLVLSALVHLRGRAESLAAAGGVVFVGALAGSIWTWGAIADAAATWVTLTVLVVLGVLVLAAPYARDRWWTTPRAVLARTGLEAGAGLAGTVSSLVGLALAPVEEVATWAAVFLTALGVVVTATALLRTDRRSLAWVGGVLLAAASWVRLADLGVHAPEAYTLPSAAALVVLGLARLRRERTAGTMDTLAPGLSLAVVPSLLWVLADPTGPRTLLLGLGCLLLVTVGARLGWTAPLVIGGLAGAVLVLRLAAPYVGDAVPRWVLIGGAGLLLVAMGATWERRTTEARQLKAYIQALR